MSEKRRNEDEEKKEERSKLTADLPAYRYYGVRRKRRDLMEKGTIVFTHVAAYYVMALLILVTGIALYNLYRYLGVFIPSMITLIIVLLIVRALYFKRLGKRVKFVRKLKRICKKRNFKLENKTGFLGSMVFISTGYHFTVQTPKTKYFVRYLTCFNYNSEVTFHNKNEIIIHTNINAIKNKFKVIFGITEQYLTKKFSFDTVFEPLPKKTENIVLLNPVPRGIDYLDRDGIKTPTGSGEKLFGYTVYNGTDFLKLLENS